MPKKSARSRRGKTTAQARWVSSRQSEEDSSTEQRASPSLQQEPIPSISSAPSPALQLPQLPQPTPSTSSAPSPTLQQPQLPQPTPSTSSAPSPTLQLPQLPQPTPSTSSAPSPALQLPQLPQPTPSTSSAPSPSAQRVQSPQPIPSTSSAPSPPLQLPQLPQPTPSTSSAPSPPLQLPQLTSYASRNVFGIPLTPLPLPPAEAEPPALSRSQKKLRLFQEYIREDIEVVDQTRTIVEMDQIKKIVADLRCPECQSVQRLRMDITKQLGLSLKLDIVCQECHTTVTSHYTSSRSRHSTSRPKPFAVNEACVLASLLAGMGAYNFRNFCEYLDLPGLHQKTFNRIATRIYAHNERLGKTVFSQAVAIVRQEYATQFSVNVDEDDVLDIAVCFDGSWLTRGHKSLIGIGSVIDVGTGLVVDTHVLSLYCQICSTTGEKIRKQTPARYPRWKEQHVAVGECTINFEGTSGMMEVTAAVELWGRSVERNKLRYTTVVSDGDSKAYNKLLETQPYGPEVNIDKEDCLNHVGKRCGTALRNLVLDCSKRGKTLGGRGHGRLTADAMRKLQVYYSRAIRNNATAEEMQRAILASLYHGYSTDDIPQHQYCPPGPDSWCFYKRSMGEHRYPTGHKKRVHTPLDYKLLHEHLEPLYKRLTALDLLRRCERKATQNPSESFHHSVWSRCSKKNLHSLKRVQFAVVSAAAEYNRGPAAASTIKDLLGFQVGEDARRLGDARTHKRVERSTLQQQQKEKRRRAKRALALEKARQEKEAEEGGPAYQPGMF